MGNKSIRILFKASTNLGAFFMPSIKPDKFKFTENINGAVAMIRALDRAIRNRNDDSSVYDKRRIVII